MSIKATIKIVAMESSYNKLKWKNGRDISEDTMEIVIDSVELACAIGRFLISREIKNSRIPLWNKDQ